MEETPLASESVQKELDCCNCGAKLVFAPGINKLKCEYCGTENEIPVSDAPIVELDLEKYINEFGDTAPTMNVVTVKCDACSAQTTFNENVVSNFCAFCGSPIVVKNASTSKIFQPKGILPFEIEKKKAEQLYVTWLGKIWWAPFGFKKRVESNDKLDGVYVPYWTYDADTSSSYTGERGDDYTVMESYTTTENGRTVTRQRPVTRTRWTRVSGSVSHFFDDVLVIASESLPRHKTEQLEPWDLSNMVPFNEAYLSGFKAECYQVDLKKGFGMAQGIMEKRIREMVNRDIGGDHQRISSLNTNYSGLTFKHILLPIWISAYRYNKKSYRYLVNGRTGEVQGEYPVSVFKILMVIALVAALVYLFSQFSH